MDVSFYDTTAGVLNITVFIEQRVSFDSSQNQLQAKRKRERERDVILHAHHIFADGDRDSFVFGFRGKKRQECQA